MDLNATLDLLSLPSSDMPHSPSAVSLNENKKGYYVRFEYLTKLLWAFLDSNDYEAIKLTACKFFPELIGVPFEIQDADGAIINAEFIGLFLNISPHGVILKLSKSQESILDLQRPSVSTDHDIEVNLSSPISNFSQSYSLGVSSCSTETLISLPGSPCLTSFDDDELFYSSNISHKKKFKTASVEYYTPSSLELKNYIISHPGGKEIINYYKQHRTLDDRNRKRLVNIFADHMLQYMPPNTISSTQTKIRYSKCIISLFPKLRDNSGTEGYEVFFDPRTKKGFFTTRLRNLFRDKETHSPEQLKNSEAISASELQIIQDKISFMKSASPKDQSNEIFKTIRETFEYRNKNRTNIAVTYPRFLDTHGLISCEFSLMFPGNNNFEEVFRNHIPIVREVYKTTITTPDPKLINETSTDGDEWNASTNSLLILIYLLPPTSSKSGRKQSAVSSISKLIVFQYMQEPLETILTEKPSNQPFILAVGTTKSAISNYYIVFDQNIVLCKTQDIIVAFDLCFKVHFVFNLHFDKSLEYFYKFIELKFYGIKVKEITNRMRELRTKLDNFMLESVNAKD